MKSITLTPEQTAVWDGKEDSERRALMRMVRMEAELMSASADGELVEIYSNDGIVVDAVSAETAE